MIKRAHEKINDRKLISLTRTATRSCLIRKCAVYFIRQVAFDAATLWRCTCDPPLPPPLLQRCCCKAIYRLIIILLINYGISQKSDTVGRCRILSSGPKKTDFHVKMRPIKFGGPIRQNFSAISNNYALDANISGIKQDIVNQKTALWIAISLARAWLMWWTFVYKRRKIGHRPTRRAVITLDIATHSSFCQIRNFRNIRNFENISQGIGC